MRIREPSRSVMRLGRRAATWGRVIPAAWVTIIAMAIAVSACGGSGPASTSGTILNTQKVERAIERSALAQRGEHAIVSCPSGVDQKQGVTFSCTAKVGKTRTRFVVTQVDGSGNVHYVAR